MEVIAFAIAHLIPFPKLHDVCVQTGPAQADELLIMAPMARLPTCCSAHETGEFVG